MYFSIHLKENPNYVFLCWELRRLSLIFHIHVSVSDLYIPRIGPHISCSRIGRPILEIYKYMSVGTGRQNIVNSVLEITDSFLGIHKWEPDIYIGFSPEPFICSVECCGSGSAWICIMLGSWIQNPIRIRVKSQIRIRIKAKTRILIRIVTVQ